MKREPGETLPADYDKGLRLPVIRSIRASEDAAISRIFHKHVQPSDSILEVGAGTGFYTFRFAAAADKVMALDSSPAMVEHLEREAKRQNLSNIEAIAGDFLEYGGTATYDWVIALGVLEYQRDPWEFLNKLSSLSNRWVLATFPTRGIWGQVYRLGSRLQGTHISIFNESEIRGRYASSVVHLEAVGLSSAITGGMTLVCLLEKNHGADPAGA